MSRWDDEDVAFGPPTKADVQGLKRQARASDDRLERAAAAGRRAAAAGDTDAARAAYADDDLALAAFDSGVEDHKAQRSARPGGAGRRPSGRPAKAARGTAKLGRRTAGGMRNLVTGRRSSDGAGLVLGLFAYAMVVNYIRYGPAGPKAWFRAKFLNEPSGLAGTTAGEAAGRAQPWIPQPGPATAGPPAPPPPAPPGAAAGAAQPWIPQPASYVARERAGLPFSTSRPVGWG